MEKATMSQFMSKRVLITGISGFIGTHLAERLLSEGAYVYGIDVKEPRPRPGANRKYKVLADTIGSAAAEQFVREAKPEYVFHLAGSTDPVRSLAGLSQMFRDNVEGFIHLCSALQGIPLRCLVNIGSAEEYGQNPVPFREDYLPDPVSPYSASKAAAAMLANMLSKTFLMPIVTVRLFLVYGPGQSERFFIPGLISRLLSGQSVEMTMGEQTRDFVYIDDAVEGLMAAALCGQLAGQVVNICSGQEYRLHQVAEMLEELTDSPGLISMGKLPYRANELMRYYGDNSKMAICSGWRPRISLAEGLQATIDWYRGQRGVIQ